MSEKLSPEKSVWGWKLLIVAFILSLIFMGVFYLAVNNEPDYMPSQQKMHTQQHAFKTAPAMAPANEQNAAASANTSHEKMHMDMKDMNMDHSSHSGGAAHQ